VVRLIKQIASTSLLIISSSFNSFFKVLFTFRSHYLFSIGLVQVFSFRWNLSPILELQSQTTRLYDWLIMLFKELNKGITPSQMKGSCSSLNPSITRSFINPSPYNSENKFSDFKVELHSLPSLVLRVSHLLSFPLLINMLKFRR